LVIDFPLQTAGINALSSFLADDLSGALDAKLRASTMIPRSKLQEFLVAQDVSPLNLQSVFIAFWPADKLRANEIITGKGFSSRTVWLSPRPSLTQAGLS
jgi:hypothetical protein